MSHFCSEHYNTSSAKTPSGYNKTLKKQIGNVQEMSVFSRSSYGVGKYSVEINTGSAFGTVHFTNDLKNVYNIGSECMFTCV